VPAGKVTFEFDVSSNVNLTLEQQDDSIFLESLSNGEHFTQTGPQRQPFRLPNFLRFSDRIDSRVLEPLPQTCTSRMVGNGIIAQRGYQHPENVVVHLVTFTPSRFLLLWLGEINVAALFEKISDTDRFTTFC
jgi:Cyclin D1 binding domain